MDVLIVKRWSGELHDVIGRLKLNEQYREAFEREPMQAVLDFAYERQEDGTLRIVSARMLPMPATPALPVPP